MTLHERIQRILEAEARAAGIASRLALGWARDTARKILEEAAEPDADMLRAGWSCVGLVTPPMVWRAMVNAARLNAATECPAPLFEREADHG